MTKEEYNDIPVYYCRDCGSLQIMLVPGGGIGEYCEECGSTYVGKTSIESWISLQETKYKQYNRKTIKTF